MRKIGLGLLLLQIIALPALALDECSLCVGVAGDGGTVAGVYALSRVPAGDLATFVPERPGETTVIVEYRLSGDGDALLEIERQTRAIVEWARQRGPFDGLGVSVTNADPALSAYATKRLSVSAQGEGVSRRIIAAGAPTGDRSGEAAAERLEAIFANGAQAYFDAVVVDADDLAATVVWIAERDPSKKIFAVVPVTSPNPMFDLAKALAAGATRAYAVGLPGDSSAALAQLNRALTGDWAYDSTATVSVLDAQGRAVEMPVLSFVRGEDLRTLLIARGDATAPAIVSVPAGRFTNPRRIDAGGEREIADSGRRGGQLLVGMPPVREPFAIAIDHVEIVDANVTKETIDIATERGITVEEIIRNHQSYEAHQESIEPRYIARNTTKLRFEIGGAEAVEATIAGDYFSDPGRDGAPRADWVWSDFYINGVKWKYGRIPELPLIQPEKVAQLPLDIHLTNDYRYQLVRTTDLLGYRVYEVRFEPPANAPAGLPLYRGTVWIDTKTWARVRISMVQLNLTGEVLSNEERVDFAPFSRQTKAPLTPAEAATSDPRALLWLPYSVRAQQVISAAGRANVVERSTTFENFRVEPEEFATLLAQASASDARMVRETEAGLRYLEKRGDERVVKEGFDTAQLFMVGGIHHDDGLAYPVVPLGGIDYFNFNLANTGIQTNVFFAGVVLAANATHPSVGGTRTNVGADLFAIGVPTENKVYRAGLEQPGESVKARPLGLWLRAGHPVAQFGKVDLSFGVAHQAYQRADDTAADFIVPSNTFIFTPAIDVRYARRGYTVSASYSYSRRSDWEPWGRPEEFDPDQQSFAQFGASIGKSFYLPKFQRIGVSVNYLDGQRLDRFSKYELGFFGAQRVHGVRSGTVRAERALIGHLSYGFVLSEQFRLEAFYDHALLDDDVAGYSGEPFQGVGIAGQTIGPYGTLLRLDIGKMIGRNAQDGFVANVVFLKLF